MLHVNILSRTLKIIYLIEDGIVAIILSSILLLSLYQIILRNFFNEGIIWGDGLVKVLVLWLGMAGAMVATRKGKQIRIDIFGNILNYKLRTYLNKVNLFFASLACLIVAYYSLQFTLLEYSYSSKAFGIIPSWITTIIIPIAFSVMALRYLFQGLIKDRLSESES